MEAQSKKRGTTLGFAAFGVAALTMIAWFRQINQVDIPENRIVFVLFFLIALALAVSAFVMRTRWFGAIPALLAVVIGGFFPFSMTISRQEVATTGIQVGQTIPVLTRPTPRSCGLRHNPQPPGPVRDLKVHLG